MTSIPAFTNDDFNIPYKTIFVGDLVGKGGFSKVYKVMHKGKVYAAKQQSVTDPSLEKYLLNELALLRFVKHDSIVGFIGASRPDEKTIYTIQEYIPGGDLRMLLEMDPPGLSWTKKALIMVNVTDALRYLHEHMIIHRDIKTDNIMLDLKLNPKLIDLGFARVCESKEAVASGKTMTCLGTDEFMAPEVTFGMPYHLAADVYSIGVVYYEVATHEVPERKAKDGFCFDWDHTLEYLYNHKRKIPDAFQSLIASASADSPDERLAMAECKSEIEELFVELKGEEQALKQRSADIVLSEEEILNRIKKKWKELLEQGDEGPGPRLSEADLETRFLVKSTDKAMELRRKSVRRAMEDPVELVLDVDSDSDDEDDIVVMDPNFYLKPQPLVKGSSRTLNQVYTVNKRTKKVAGRNPNRRQGTQSEIGLRVMNDGTVITRSNIGQLTVRAKTGLATMMKSVRGMNKGVRDRWRKQSAMKQSSPVKRIPGKAGYLNRKPRVALMGWRKKYVVLTHEGFLYFNSKSGRKKNDLKGALLFLDMTANAKNCPALMYSVAAAKRPFCFAVLTREGKKVFQAESQRERDDWIRRLNRGYQMWSMEQERNQDSV